MTFPKPEQIVDAGPTSEEQVWKLTEKYGTNGKLVLNAYDIVNPMNIHYIEDDYINTTAIFLKAAGDRKLSEIPMSDVKEMVESSFGKKRIETRNITEESMGLVANYIQGQAIFEEESSR